VWSGGAGEIDAGCQCSIDDYQGRAVTKILTELVWRDYPVKG
jgi:hypothetical protein